MNNKRFLFLIVVICYCSSCWKMIPEGEHKYLSFENNSEYDISLAESYFSSHPIRIPRWTGADGEHPEYPNHQERVSAGTKDPKVLGLLWERTFETFFRPEDNYNLYVFPKYYSREEWEELNPKKWGDLAIVVYYLTISDIAELNFHLTFPPDERMKEISMVPPYSTFHSE